MNQYIYVRPRDDGQGWAIDVYDGRRAWAKTHLGERPLNKAEAHRVAHKLRDPKFYSVRTKRAVNSGAQEGMGEARVGTMPGSGIPLPHPPCTPGVRDPDHPCDMFSPGKTTNGGCQGEVPTEFFEGEWHFPKADGPEPWAVITYTDEPSPETGHVGWCWWALGMMGDDPTYEGAKRKAETWIQARVNGMPASGRWA